MQFRRLECTDCCNVMTEKGERIKERIGEVVMRRCDNCAGPTVHVILDDQKLKHDEPEPELLEMT